MVPSMYIFKQTTDKFMFDFHFQAFFFPIKFKNAANSYITASFKNKIALNEDILYKLVHTF